MPDEGSNHNKPGITILGQHVSYPSDKFSLFGLLSIVLSICILAYIALYLAKTENIAAITNALSVYSVDLDGKVKKYRDGKIVKFWTPSKRTKETNGVKEWEMIGDTEDKLIEFGKTLSSNKRVYGYRRHEIFGKGRTPEKWGWWWIVTVDSKFEMKELMKMYREIFRNDRSIYVEILGEPGSYQ